MRIPTKARYGMRAMLDLALNGGEKEPVLMRDIAARQALPEKYLEQVLIPLRNAGLVRGVRGARGGYRLARSPSEISLLQIVETCMGDLSMVDCTEDPGYCERTDACAARLVWKELTETIRESLHGKTLADLVEDDMRLKCERDRVGAAQIKGSKTGGGGRASRLAGDGKRSGKR